MNITKEDGKAYVYKLYNLAGELIYVGETVDLYRRITEHKNRFILGNVKYYVVKDKQESGMLEAYLIHKLEPTFNKKNRKSLIDSGEILFNVQGEELIVDGLEGISAVPQRDAKNYIRDCFTQVVSDNPCLHKVSSLEYSLRTAYEYINSGMLYGYLEVIREELSMGWYLYNGEVKVVLGGKACTVKEDLTSYLQENGVVVASTDKVVSKIKNKKLMKLIKEDSWMTNTKYLKLK